VVYSVACTFSAVYAGLVYMVSDDVRLLSTVPQLQWAERNSTLALSEVILRQWSTERQRQARLIDSQRQACVQYVDDLTAAVALKLDDVTATVMTRSRQPSHYDDVDNDDGLTVTSVVESRLLAALVHYDASLDNFKQRYHQRLARDMSASRRGFVNYLSSVESNAWLSFARGLFNQTTDAAGVISHVIVTSLYTSP